MKITKNHIGKKIWVVPIGNNVKRDGTSDISQAREVVITKMARIRGEFEELMPTYTTKFYISDYSESVIKECDNSGYIVFETYEDIKLLERSREVKRYLQSSLTTLTIEELLKIGKVLDI